MPDDIPDDRTVARLDAGPRYVTAADLAPVPASANGAARRMLAELLAATSRQTLPLGLRW